MHFETASRYRLRQQFWTSSNWISVFHTSSSYLRRCQWRSKGDSVPLPPCFLVFPPLRDDRARMIDEKWERLRSLFFVWMRDNVTKLFLWGLKWRSMECSNFWDIFVGGRQTLNTQTSHWCRQRWERCRFVSFTWLTLDDFQVTLNKKYDDGFILYFNYSSFPNRNFSGAHFFLLSALLTMIKCFSFAYKYFHKFRMIYRLEIKIKHVVFLLHAWFFWVTFSYQDLFLSSSNVFIIIFIPLFLLKQIYFKNKM